MIYMSFYIDINGWYRVDDVYEGVEPFYFSYQAGCKFIYYNCIASYDDIVIMQNFGVFMIIQEVINVYMMKI